MQADDATWLAGVARALEPIVDDGRGTFAWLTRSGCGGPTFDRLLFMEAPFDEALLLEMHADAEPEDFLTAYPRGPGIHSLALAYGPRRYRESRFMRRWVHGRSIVDSGGIHVALGDRRLLVGSFFREEAVFPVPMRRFGETLSARIERAFRVRAALARETQPSAVLTPEAKVVHAEGAVRVAASLEGLRDAVVRREKARGSMRHRDPAATLELFDGVVSGRFTIVDRFESDGRRYLVAYESPPEIAEVRALTAREREIFERAMHGEPVKRIALDLGISPSAAAAYLAAVRRKTGLRSREEMVRWFRAVRGPMAGARPRRARDTRSARRRPRSRARRREAGGAGAVELASIYAKVGVGSRVELIASFTLR